MENHHHHHNLLLKVSRLFPSSLTSCQFRTIPDVAQNSLVTISKTKYNDPSSFVKKPEKITKKIPNFSDIEGRKCPPVTPISTNVNPKKKPHEHKRNDSTTFSSVTDLQAIASPESLSSAHSKNNSQKEKKQISSSSTNSGWFSSSDDKKSRDETDTFFSFNSTSGDSFRLKASRRFEYEMKSIDETTRNPSKNIKKKIIGEYQVEYDDQISTQIYYSNGKKNRSRSRSRSRKMRSSRSSALIEESYAVEKSSKDPRGDFRASMVEMILEKQMFGKQDLDRLLHCFLSLNAVSYHGIILDVFSEICQTLFTY